MNNLTEYLPGSESAQHHRDRSDFVRTLVQHASIDPSKANPSDKVIPRVIVQFWHDDIDRPADVDVCIDSWKRWESSGFIHTLFCEKSARSFISHSLGRRYEQAFDICYHPAMQSDYFRLCYLLVKGGFYVDADDECVGDNIECLFNDGRLKLQPLCYDNSTDSMVNSSVFQLASSFSERWIFYFNNNPLIAPAGHIVIERALDQATRYLELAGERGLLPEIQSATGPGNLSKSIYELGLPNDRINQELAILRNWESIAISKWPLSYRNDSRNWRHSNGKRFNQHGDIFK